MKTIPKFDKVAAVDLGSNSFHMIIARVADGELKVEDRLREMVQLGMGLDENHRLKRTARERALACLERFGQRLRGMPPGSVRVVGTNTLRQARDPRFLEAAEEALGHPVEVIAGREEARLVYLGVAHSVAVDDGRRLVMDIGGGSTEFIVGTGFKPLERESLHMGCVSMSRLFFPDGRITRTAFEQAEIAARLQLQPIAPFFREMGWERTIGASGTILAVEQAVRGLGWSDGGITREALGRLRERLIELGNVQNIDLDGVSSQRSPVFPGGVAVLYASFLALGIEKMEVSDGALREGVVYDLLGRIHQEDVRERTIGSLVKRYDVDTEHAARVERTAGACLEKVSAAWGLESPEDEQLLSWAARLHEMGLAVAHTKYHRHGAYLVENADLAGFSRQEQQQLAALIHGHRRKFPAARIAELGDDAPRIARLCALLRLAVLLNRSRDEAQVPEFELKANPQKNTLRLTLPGDWLDRRPLTVADLTQEGTYLKAAKIKLKFERSGGEEKAGETEQGSAG